MQEAAAKGKKKDTSDLPHHHHDPWAIGGNDNRDKLSSFSSQLANALSNNTTTSSNRDWSAQ